MIKKDILDYLKFIQTEAKCKKGIYIPILLNHFGVLYSDVQAILNDLHKEKKILVKQGINGKLIYYK